MKKSTKEKAPKVEETIIPKEEPIKEVEVTSEVTDNVEATIKPSKVIKIEVYNKNNQVVREYSKEIHGEGFMDLAKSYADKFKFFIR